MKKKRVIIPAILLSLIILGGCHKMDNQNTEKSSQSSSQAKTYTAAEIKQNQIKFLKAHEQEIKNYILAGVPKDVAAQVTDIQIDYDSLENQFSGFLSSSNYWETKIKLTVTSAKKQIDGKIFIIFGNYRNPKEAEIDSVVLFDITSEGETITIDNPKELMK